MFAGTQVSHLLGSKFLIKISSQQIYTLKTKSLPEVIFLQYSFCYVIPVFSGFECYMFEWSVVNGNVLGQDQIPFICIILKADWPDCFGYYSSK